MSPPPFYAHTLEGRPPEDWEPLETHLQDVAKLAEQFASAFGAGEWGRLAGLWHDLGKYLPDFQRRIRGEQIQVEHAGAGAALAAELVNDSKALAFVIAGHHAGLANYQVRGDAGEKNVPLDERLKRGQSAMAQSLREMQFDPKAVASIPTGKQGLALPNRFDPRKPSPEMWLSFGLWVRMVFSALVDADSLMTEKFCSPDKAESRERLTASYDGMATLQQRLDNKLDLLGADDDSSINVKRRQILGWCREASALEPGFFTLAVPTGGGKTLASMSFALRHVLANADKGLRRIVMAVPYCSIIDQSAEVLKKYLGAGNVVEHHSNLDDYRDKEEDSEDAVRRRFAVESYDAPCVLTTNVMLLESLFTNKRSRARKLHNLVGSVIVLDEAQCVPVPFLECILRALRDLVLHYKCSVVICTATQPAWLQREGFTFGLPAQQVRPIIPPEASLLADPVFQRVQIEWPESGYITSYNELVAQMAAEPCALAIVHRKKDVVQVVEGLAAARPGERLFHLSTNMCPYHRKRVLKKVRAALRDFHRDGTPVRICATMLIEAGVDISVPVLFRAMAGLEAVAQASGRCNRNGELAEKGMLGRVVIFNAETEPPDSHLQKCAEVTGFLLRKFKGDVRINDGAHFDAYFQRLYRHSNTDEAHLTREIEELKFETISRKFRMIDDEGQVSLVVPYNAEARRRIATFRKRLEFADVGVAAMRALQPFTVSVYRSEFNKLRDALVALDPGNKSRAPVFAALEEGSESWVLNLDQHPNAYSLLYGLQTSEEAVRCAPDQLVC